MKSRSLLFKIKMNNNIFQMFKTNNNYIKIIWKIINYQSKVLVKTFLIKTR